MEMLSQSVAERDLASLTETDVLRALTAAMQAKYPERSGEIGRAYALIINGDVTDLGDGTGRVLSSNQHTHYTVTQASCTCEAGTHKTPCKHLSAWRLARLAATKYRALPSHVRPPCPLDVPSGEPAPVPPPCPEAAFSLTLRGSMDGMDAQLTVRGATADGFLANVAAIKGMLVAPPIQGPGQPSPEAPDLPAPEAGQLVVAPADEQRFCPKHGTRMMLNHKDGDSWWSHRLPDKSWCRSK